MDDPDFRRLAPAIKEQAVALLSSISNDRPGMGTAIGLLGNPAFSALGQAEQARLLEILGHTKEARRELPLLELPVPTGLQVSLLRKFIKEWEPIVTGLGKEVDDVVNESPELAAKNRRGSWPRQAAD